MPERYQRTIDQFFDFSRIQGFLERDSDAGLAGEQEDRWVELYSGPSQLFTPQTVTNSHFAKDVSFPWLSDIGEYTPTMAREYLWVNDPKKHVNARMHLESGKLEHGSLVGRYAGIHFQTERIARRQSELPSIGNICVKLILTQLNGGEILGYRRDYDKRLIGGRRGDYTAQFPSREFLKSEYENVPVHQQLKN